MTHRLKPTNSYLVEGSPLWSFHINEAFSIFVTPEETGKPEFYVLVSGIDDEKLDTTGLKKLTKDLMDEGVWVKRMYFKEDIEKLIAFCKSESNTLLAFNRYVPRYP